MSLCAEIALVVKIGEGEVTDDAAVYDVHRASLEEAGCVLLLNAVLDDVHGVVKDRLHWRTGVTEFLTDRLHVPHREGFADLVKR